MLLEVTFIQAPQFDIGASRRTTELLLLPRRSADRPERLARALRLDTGSNDIQESAYGNSDTCGMAEARSWSPSRRRAPAVAKVAAAVYGSAA
jgi:hypothetical protein